MQDLLDVIDVKAMPDFTLELEFENGERKRFDMKPLLVKEPFVVLKDFTLFEKVHAEAGTVVWPGEIDIAPETLYRQSKPI